MSTKEVERKVTPFRTKELPKVKRALNMLTRATETLIQAVDEQQLLNDICRILVEDGDYLFCWVGYVQYDDEKSIWPVARAGIDRGILSKSRTSWDETRPSGQGGAGIAVRSRRPCIVRESEIIAHRGADVTFKSALAIPLVVEGRVIGVLCLYSADLDAFDDDELGLMENLARNVAYGIGMQRLQFDRRRAERELKESEGRYRSLVELGPDAILVHTQGIIIFSNSAADRLFRVEAEHSMIGKRISDLVAASTDLTSLLGLDGEEAHCSAVEERFIRGDGSQFEAEVTLAPIVFHGVHAYQVIIRDITERKQVHSQLVQTAKLATLGEMAAGMAHELSQPINIMRMAAEGALLLIGRQKATQDYQIKQFALISAQASRMADIIDHIRIFSRKDTSGVVVFDARTALQLAVDLMEPHMASNDVEACASIPEQPCPVSGRPVQLEQVIINLLSNAVDAIKEARARSGKTKRGVVSLLAEITPANNLRIMVTDNGSGISKEDIDRVFEPFFTTKEVGSGTGLGLSVSFGIISSMGGRLVASNAPKGGAQFTITLPLTQDQPESAPEPSVSAPQEPSENTQTRHLLLVDDEPHAIATMGTYFSELGYRVSQAYSGNSAFKMFQEDPADLVVTDIRMPDGDGEQLVTELRKVAPELPIVVVTGHMGTTEGLQRNRGGDGLTIVKKPISLATMAETVEKMLQPY